MQLEKNLETHKGYQSYFKSARYGILSENHDVIYYQRIFQISRV